MAGGLLQEIMEPFQTLREMNKRQLIAQGFSLGLIVTSALIIWKVGESVYLLQL